MGSTELAWAAGFFDGTITKVPPNALSKKQRWQWRLQRSDEARQVLAKLGPYMTQVHP